MHFRLKPQTPNAKIETPNRIQRYRIGNPKLRNQIGNLSQLTYKIPEAAVVSSDSASMEKHAARSRSSSSKHQNAYVAKNIISQDLFTPDYILNRIFRKDGPPLGVKFDSLPSGKLFHCKDPEILYSSCKESQRAAKKTKEKWCLRRILLK
ncbi:uncharacterized protein LOC133820979 isoform X2 [Humulus lupulus]|uniref:uncharacterized protein LOC133820979 isoform X2 n=1 Tax=Humulus lupulus TaxID=3486 RepID=UPI002B415516|nr:uncharacterized protein LOC133820979 isoform X2 [Humulus lupulus]XP_062109510.1 uncharacterized protein LOC133820979 isoform X2 [Humulus lupulus]XP_062109511.1 uncharacterized protein LOC133820979 isoform X2 [Humulus lupulus]